MNVSKICRVMRISALLFCSFLYGCALITPRDKASISEPGGRWVSHEVPVHERAVQDVVFAWLSEAAYPKAQQRRPGCPSGEQMLDKYGWSRVTQAWFTMPELDNYATAGLYFDVWRHADPPEAIAVSFRGTDLSSWQHLKANLRWILQDDHDTYATVVNTFSLAFKEKYEHHFSDLNLGKKPSLYATGHSLGGGLAHAFAYSLPASEIMPRVNKIVVFNTSPVTAKNITSYEQREKNLEHLIINRVYQVSDPLDVIRVASATLLPPSRSKPQTRLIRYNFADDLSPLGFHEISRLACGLAQTLKDQTEPVVSPLFDVFSGEIPP